MDTLLTSFFLILLAEMGDKTQLMAMAFTTRFKVIVVILAVICATILNNLLAVVTGHLIAGVFPLTIIKVISFIFFIFFGLWTIYGDNNEKTSDKKVIINPFFTVAILFFISEFGDKTQIATMTLAMNQSPVFVFIGATLGMIGANLIGIGAGTLLVKKIPEAVIKWVVALIFILIGVAGFWSVFREKFLTNSAIILEAAIICAVILLILIAYKRGKR